MWEKNSGTKLLVLVMLMFLVSQARGIEHLTINGEDVDSIDLSVGQSCTIEVVSDGVGMPYIRRLAPTNFSVSDLELLEIKSEAGTGASAIPGATYYTLQAGTGMVAGVHFVFGYTATATGQKGVELRYIMGGDPIDSIVINVSSAPAGTAFTYQGKLSDGDSAADGEYDFEFKVYNSPTAGDQFGLTVNQEDVSVDQGNFTVKLDFVNDPNVFNGEARWLAIGVRPWDDSGSFTPLSLRQELTPTPYALYALNGSGGSGFWTAEGNDIYNTNSGNVGIGTSSPAWELDVANLAAGDGAEVGVTANDAGGAIAAYSSTLGAPFAHYAGRVSLFSNLATMGLDLRADSIIGDMRFYTGGPWTTNERMRITSNGGTRITSYRDDGLGSWEEGLYFANNSNLMGPWSHAGIWADGVSGYNGELVFGVDGDDTNNLTGIQEAMRIDKSGNLGVGTTSPEAKLHSVSTDMAKPGVYGENLSTGYGVYGKSAFAGVKGEGQRAIYAKSDTMFGIYSEAPKNYFSGYVGIGTMNPQKALDVAGWTRTEVLEITGGSDLAEPFEIGSADTAKPGMVVCIDPENPGELQVSHNSYDRRVAGIISGAGGIKPGMVMGQKGSKAYGSTAVALTGRVYCLADASNGPIRPGDLLTTSDIPGHAMTVTDYTKAQGAIIGKAMSSLKQGQGLVLVLVTLQ